MVHGMLMRMKNEITRRKSKQASEEAPSVDEKLPSELSECVIAINDLAMEGLHSCSSGKCSMFRIPASIRELDQTAYEPKLVSIGPFHADKLSLQGMDEHKFRYLLCILNARHTQDGAEGHTDQAGPSNPAGNNYMETLVKAMKNLEWETRNFYSENFQEVTSDDFVMMMVLDGCFVIQLLRFYNKAFYNEENVDDPILASRWMLPILLHDLFLLENQLPLFVLKKLFQLTRIDGEPSLIELTLKFFDSVLPRDQEILESKCMITEDYDHLLDVFRSSFTSFIETRPSEKRVSPIALPLRSLISTFKTKLRPHPRQFPVSLSSFTSKRKQAVTPMGERRLVRSVTELEEAGIKFKKMKDRDLLDIRFKQGVLQIPTLMVDDYTKPLFLNMVAYEQCCPQRDPYFTYYILFLDGILNSPRDVEKLYYYGIIDHVLGSDEEVAILVNQLATGVVYDVESCYLSEQLNKIHSYTELKWNKLRANLVHRYFKNPWILLSVLPAIFLLCLTIAEAIFSFLSYLRPPTQK